MTITKTRYERLPARNQALHGKLRRALECAETGDCLTLAEFRPSHQSFVLNLAKKVGTSITTRKNEDGTLSIYVL